MIAFAEQARISRQLVLLREDAPTPLEMGAMKTPPRNMDVLKAFLVEQDFKRLLVRIGASADAADKVSNPAVRSMGGTLSTNANQDQTAKDSAMATRHDAQSLRNIEADYTLITDREALVSFLGKARKQGFLAVDTETSVA